MTQHCERRAKAFLRPGFVHSITAVIVTIFLTGRLALPVIYANYANRLIAESAQGLAALKDPSIIPKASSYLRGVAAYQEGHWQEARLQFQASLPTHGNLARLSIVKSTLAQGDWDVALDQIDVSQSSDWPLVAKILAEHSEEMSEKQRQNYFSLIDKNPILSSGYFHQLLSQGRFDEVIEYAPSFSGYDKSTQMQLMVGRAYFYKRDYENAVAVFQSVNAQQTTLDNTIWLGKALFNSGQQEKGLRYLEAILQEPVGRRHIPYLVDLSVAYAAAGRCFDAQEVLNGATESDRTGAHRTLLEGAKQTVADRCQG